MDHLLFDVLVKHLGSRRRSRRFYGKFYGILLQFIRQMEAVDRLSHHLAGGIPQQVFRPPVEQCDVA